MFTGLISDIGTIIDMTASNDTTRLRIACAYPADGIALGASIACSGPCLTAVHIATEQGRTIFDVEAAKETLERTTLADWRIGRRINLERSLKIGDELGGHLVSGHVDGIATVLARTEYGTTSRFDIEAPWPLARFIAEKGSVSLDGTSLTVNSVEQNRFSVLLIPHSLAVTTWNEVVAGSRLNLEIDQMARYAARLADPEARS
ncbi:riboflavin synthase [Lichenihabitans sp. PAMC28606]|uniref:riboflavin synthase n=1 Tax=Lichenihabitans sp. PAMC28606 TaxID=2880932 RepID=UPI001D0AA982|nr:riboflavin synthase [Lichenihabitans sp. PAMC28606]UDL95241.1 riboflavin synthase [Lichenihabitans sp. PAMC28606]